MKNKLIFRYIAIIALLFSFANSYSQVAETGYFEERSTINFIVDLIQRSYIEGKFYNCDSAHSLNEYYGSLPNYDESQPCDYKAIGSEEISKLSKILKDTMIYKESRTVGKDTVELFMCPAMPNKNRQLMVLKPERGGVLFIYFSETTRSITILSEHRSEVFRFYDLCVNPIGWEKLKILFAQL